MPGLRSGSLLGAYPMFTQAVSSSRRPHNSDCRTLSPAGRGRIVCFPTRHNPTLAEGGGKQMLSREVAYETWDLQKDAVDRLTKKLSSDLRFLVRRLALYEPLTEPWRLMNENVAGIATFANIELFTDGSSTQATKETTQQPARGFVSSSSSVLVRERSSAADATAQAGKKTGPTTAAGGEYIEWVRDGSIWDREDVVTRQIMEEGKLNVLLRMVVDFAAFQCVGNEFAEAVQKDPVAVESQTRQFESSVGVIMCCCLRSVEVLQTVDLPLLFEFIAHCLSHPHQNAKISSLVAGENEEVLSTWSIQMLAEIFSSCWGLPGVDVDLSGRSEIARRVLALACQYAILNSVMFLVEKDVHTGHSAISSRTLHAAAVVISSALSSEWYTSNQLALWGLAERSSLLQRYALFQPLFAERLKIAMSSAAKKRYRPILDAILSAKMTLR